MVHKGLPTTAVRHLGHAVSAICHLGIVVWQAARSCFSLGWNNDLGWDNDAGWDNN